MVFGYDNLSRIIETQRINSEVPRFIQKKCQKRTENWWGRDPQRNNKRKLPQPKGSFKTL